MEIESRASVVTGRARNVFDKHDHNQNKFHFSYYVVTSQTIANSQQMHRITAYRELLATITLKANKPKNETETNQNKKHLNTLKYRSMSHTYYIQVL